MDWAIIYDQKRHKLERRARVFRYIPFVKAVYIAGSMALGNATEKSDFDLLVVAQPGRLYICRFFTLLFFSLLGWRTDVESGQMKDGFCFNHFVIGIDANIRMNANDTNNNPNGFLEYEKRLRENLAPLYINNRTSDVQNINVNIGTSDVPIIERILRWWQQRRIRQQIERWQKPGVPSRLVVNDEEVHLCFRLRTLDK